MTPLTRVKLLVGGTGVAIWAWGVRTADDRLRWAGIALLAIAFAMRLLNRRLGEPSRRR